MKIAIFSILIVTLSTLFCFSQPGTHDILFDNNGVVKTNFGKKSVDVAYDVFVLSDGKIVAAGPLSPDTNILQTGLTRYLSNGAPDSSFDGDGQLIIEIGTNVFQSKILAVAPGGKMFIGGYVQYANKNFPAVISLLANGNINTGYGENGYYTDTSIEGQITSITLQPDEKLIVAGYSGSTAGNYKLLTQRLTINGIRDDSFDDDQIENIEAYGALTAIVTLQSDGKIIIGGTRWAANADFALRRFNGDGSVDVTFGTAGLVQTNINSTDYLSDVIIQPDGKILASGNSFPGGVPEKAVIVRYNNDGSLDNSFDGDGKKIISDSKGHNFDAIAIQGDGKIVAAGYLLDYTNFAATYRFNNDGSDDISFGTDGHVIDSIGENSSLKAITIQNDGRILVAGKTRKTNYYDFLLIRYNNELEECGIPVDLFTTNITATSAILNWTPVGSPVKFKIRYKTPFTDAIVITVPDGNATSYLLSGLEPSTSYTWRIQEICNGSHSPYSVKQPFNTAPLKIEEEYSDRFDLSIYPNPVTDFATVHIAFAKSSEIKIELFDLQGRKIKTIAEGNFVRENSYGEAGNYQLQFARENLPPGIYLIELTTDSGTLNQKLIIQ